MSVKRFEDVVLGESIGALVKAPDEVTLFRFSAVTWNAHRIHYDQPYAVTEGYPGILVQSHLHGCHLCQLVVDWAGPLARVRRFGFQNKAIAVAGDVLTCVGTVSRTYYADGIGQVDCVLEERNQAGDLCATGWATLSFAAGDL